MANCKICGKPVRSAHVVIRLGYPGKILAFEESSPQLLEWLKQPAEQEG